MKSIIQAHNRKILNTKPQAQKEKKCNCQISVRDQCPLKNDCQQYDVIYEATTSENPPKKYVGSTIDFKKRYGSHKFSFKTLANKMETALSKHVWDNNLGQFPTISWRILKHAKSYGLGGKSCNLCLTEKYIIMKTSITPPI